MKRKSHNLQCLQLSNVFCLNRQITTLELQAITKKLSHSSMAPFPNPALLWSGSTLLVYQRAKENAGPGTASKSAAVV